jgi:hypothetical protein
MLTPDAIHDSSPAYRFNGILLMGSHGRYGCEYATVQNRAWQLLQRRPRDFHLRFHLLGPVHNDWRVCDEVAPPRPWKRSSLLIEILGSRGAEHPAATLYGRHSVKPCHKIR